MMPPVMVASFSVSVPLPSTVMMPPVLSTLVTMLKGQHAESEYSDGAGVGNVLAVQLIALCC